MKKILLSASAFFSLPLISLADTKCGSVISYDTLLTCILSILNSLIPIIIALIILWIVWSAFQFAKAEGEERSKYRDAMVWGIVAIFVTVTIWGLVGILTGTFGNLVTAPKPTLPDVTQFNQSATK